MIACNADVIEQFNLLQAEFLDNCGQRGQWIKSAYAAMLMEDDPGARADAHKLAGAADTLQLPLEISF